MYDVLEFSRRRCLLTRRDINGRRNAGRLIEAVSRGVDMFDCVLPTRNGRTGGVFTSRGKLNIRNANSPVIPSLWTGNVRVRCAPIFKSVSQTFVPNREMLAAILISHHNLAFYLDTMRKVRDSIKLGDFTRFRKDFLGKMQENASAGV